MSTAKAAAPLRPAMSVFERYLTVWVALCIVAGLVLGPLFPGPVQAIGGMEFAQVNLPVVAFQPSLYLALQPGRQISNQQVLFIVPKDDLFKLINVTPNSGKPFSINWWATPKATVQDLIIRFYGITDWIADPNQQGLVIQLRLGNNGSSSLPVSPENFTLLDQWGRDYYPVAGFEPMTIAPGMATGRVQVGFTGLSPLSRPAALVFNGQKIIDLETEMIPLSDAVVAPL